ncbi:MAG: carboxymuconolactone decarboxylase family protein [Solirubrobacterales bacterium]|nr:carboxymuconolactone decarboxylase family protein [Solirubrobacterales bacterium]
MSEYTLPLALKDTATLLRHLPSVWGIWGRKRLDPHLREEVMVAVAASVGCRYCTFSHREMILQSGESLLALAEFEQVENPDERVFAAIVWAQAKVEADFGPAPAAIEQEMRDRFDAREQRDLETVAIAMKSMSSCGHQADGLVQRLSGHSATGRLGNQILMAFLYFPPAVLVYGALAAKRGSARTLFRDFRQFSTMFTANGTAKDAVPETSTQPAARV